MRNLEACPICTGNDSALIYTSTLSTEISSSNIPNPYSAHYQINQCNGCSLLFSSPILDDDGVNALYTESEEGNVTLGEEDNVRYTMCNYYKLIKPHLLEKTRVLDIGCDVGYFLEAAMNDGFFNLYGLEPTKPAREVSAKLPNSTISEKFYEEIEYPTAHFDLISMIHVLDHLVNPAIALRKAKMELRNGGLMFAVVHNSKSLLAIIMGEKFPVYNLYHHYFFTKKTLRKLLESQGFQVIKVVSTKNCYSLNFFIHKMPFLPTILKKNIISILKILHLHKIKLNFSIGNIGIIAKKII